MVSNVFLALPRTGRGSFLTRTVLAAGVVSALLLCGLALSGPAAAHNALHGTSPSDGASVSAPPEEITLTFDDKVIDLGIAVGITGPGGIAAVEGDPVVKGDTVTQSLAADLPAGAYDVVWRVTSADGHPIDGEFSFTTEGATTPAPATEDPTPAESANPTPTETATATPSAEATTTSPAAPSPSSNASTPNAVEAEGGISTMTIAVIVALVLAAVWGALALTRARRNRQS